MKTLVRFFVLCCVFSAFIAVEQCPPTVELGSVPSVIYTTENQALVFNAKVRPMMAPIAHLTFWSQFNFGGTAFTDVIENMFLQIDTKDSAIILPLSYEYGESDVRCTAFLPVAIRLEELHMALFLDLNNEVTLPPDAIWSFQTTLVEGIQGVDAVSAPYVQVDAERLSIEVVSAPDQTVSAGDEVILFDLLVGFNTPQKLDGLFLQAYDFTLPPNISEGGTLWVETSSCPLQTSFIDDSGPEGQEIWLSLPEDSPCEMDFPYNPTFLRIVWKTVFETPAGTIRWEIADILTKSLLTGGLVTGVSSEQYMQKTFHSGLITVKPE